MKWYSSSSKLIEFNPMHYFSTVETRKNCCYYYYYSHNFFHFVLYISLLVLYSLIWNIYKCANSNLSDHRNTNLRRMNIFPPFLPAFKRASLLSRYNYYFCLGFCGLHHWTPLISFRFDFTPSSCFFFFFFLNYSIRPLFCQLVF